MVVVSSLNDDHVSRVAPRLATYFELAATTEVVPQPPAKQRSVCFNSLICSLGASSNKAVHCGLKDECFTGFQVHESFPL
jgi:hypothetical protein